MSVTGDYFDESMGEAFERGMAQGKARIDELEVRQQELLATIRKLSAEVPYPEESTNAATLIAEVGTLRAQLAEAKRETTPTLGEAFIAGYHAGWDAGSFPELRGDGPGARFEKWLADRR